MGLYFFTHTFYHLYEKKCCFLSCDWLLSINQGSRQVHLTKYCLPILANHFGIRYYLLSFTIILETSENKIEEKSEKSLIIQYLILASLEVKHDLLPVSDDNNYYSRNYCTSSFLSKTT